MSALICFSDISPLNRLDKRRRVELFKFQALYTDWHFILFAYARPEARDDVRYESARSLRHTSNTTLTLHDDN
eukprot:759390-Hanusia_phi.AAC.4